MGVSTCKALVVLIHDKQFNTIKRHIAHIPPLQSVENFLPQLSQNETAYYQVFHGPKSSENQNGRNNSTFNNIRKSFIPFNFELSYSNSNNGTLLQDESFNIYFSYPNKVHIISD